MKITGRASGKRSGQAIAIGHRGCGQIASVVERLWLGGGVFRVVRGELFEELQGLGPDRVLGGTVRYECRIAGIGDRCFVVHDGLRWLLLGCRGWCWA